ncbi:CMRF35-like molecule 5 isoform X2 [Narcine bancroftii]
MDFAFLYFVISFSVTKAALSGPLEVNGSEGQSVNITCTYSTFYHHLLKYWCKGKEQSTCTILVKTRGTTTSNADGRISITADDTAGEFTVTMKQLTLSDQGWYWCAITTRFVNLHHPVNLKVIESHRSLLTAQSPGKEIGKNNSKYQIIWRILRWSFLAILVVWGIVTVKM